jgi:hypothetical protein
LNALRVAEVGEESEWGLDSDCESKSYTVLNMHVTILEYNNLCELDICHREVMGPIEKTRMRGLRRI